MVKTTPEDLMRTVLAADIARRRHVGERVNPYPRWKRIWVEPFFNLLGLLMGQILVSMPWPLRWRSDQRINLRLGGRLSAEPSDFSQRRDEVVALARRLREEGGQWPAMMVFISHPTTSGPLEWLRFELVREGLQLANAVVEISQAGWYRRAPQCFLAIDPYALDTIPTPVAGFYAGLMHRMYLAWDRMSWTQSALQRWFVLRGTGYPTIFKRLMARLKQSIPVVMVLPGGLPFNARALYTAREFVHHLPVRRWPYPKRLAQKKWIEALIEPVDGQLALLRGVIPESTRPVLLALLAEWGIPDVERGSWLNRFAEEFKLDAPYRLRLFRVLFRRLVAKGKPFMWIAISHSAQAPHVRIASPWGAWRGSDGALRVIRRAAGPAEALSDISRVAMDFSQGFVV